MSNQEKRNLAASIHRRLLNKASESGRPFNELLQYYAMERFLFRLSRSPHSKKFVLKGALMLVAWDVSFSRPTSDIDLLGMTDNDVGAIVSILKDICTMNVEADGIEFDPGSVAGEVVVEVAEYPGVRARIRANLGTAIIRVQIDVGFGDPIVPGPRMFDYPALLDMPAPRLKGYSRESVVAEKLESIARFGILNSRLKDFFDIWLLARQFDFDGETLHAAVDKTFSNRARPVNAEIIVQMKAYADDDKRSVQWRAFCRKNKLTSVPLDLLEVVESIVEFIKPIVAAVSEGEPIPDKWHAPGPWQRE